MMSPAGFKNHFSVAALVMGLASSALFDTLAQVLGFQATASLAFQMLVQIALLIGFYPQKKFFEKRRVLWALSGLMLLIGFFRSDFIQASAQFFLVKIVAALFITAVFLVVFSWTAKDLYRGQVVTGIRYGTFHLQALLAFWFATALSEFAAKNLVFFIIGLLLFSYSSKKIASLEISENLNVSGGLLKKSAVLACLGFSILSGAQVVWIWQMINNLIRGTGWEFVVWQSVAFLALGLSPVIAKKMQAEQLARYWILIFYAIVVYFFNQTVNNDVVSNKEIWFVWVLLSSPLIITATMVPSYEKNESAPWLWLGTVGNTLGLIAGWIFFEYLGLQGLTFLIAGGLAIFLVLHSRNLVILIGKVIICGLVFLKLMSVNDLKILDLAKYYNRQPSSATLATQALIVRHQGETAKIITFENQPTNLWLNSYNSTLGGLREVHQAFYGVPAIERGANRVLILGLGNTQLLSAVQKIFTEKNVKDYTVDVVENFTPLLNQKIISALAEKTSLQLADPRINFVYKDAFEFLQQNEKPYDLIYWNLSQPFGDAVSRLYSDENLRNVKQSLISRGTFVGFLDFVMLGRPEIACLYRTAFADGRFFPGVMSGALPTRRYFVVDPAVSTWPDLEGDVLGKNCESAQSLTLNRNLYARSMDYFRVTQSDLKINFKDEKFLNSKTKLDLNLPLAVRWSLVSIGWGRPLFIAHEDLVAGIRAYQVAKKLVPQSQTYLVNPSLSAGSVLQVYNNDIAQAPGVNKIKMSDSALSDAEFTQLKNKIKLPSSFFSKVQAKDVQNDWSLNSEKGFFRWSPFFADTSCAANEMYKQFFYAMPDAKFAFYFNQLTEQDSPSKSLTYVDSQSGRAISTAKNFCEYPAKALKLPTLPEKPKAKTFTQTLQLWKESEPEADLAKDWAIAPCASTDLDQFIQSSDKKNLSEKKWINCVTALDKFDSQYKQVSAFPSAGQYLDGVLARLQKRLETPRRIIFLADNDTIYLKEVLAQALEKVRTAIENVEVLSIDINSTSELQLTNKDWVVVWSAAGPYDQRASNVKGFYDAHKIVIYGTTEIENIWPNSTQVLFWHPHVAYEETGANCSFALKFKTRFNEGVDFHGAYFWATLQLAAKQEPTILGNIRLDAHGRNEDYRPILCTRDSKDNYQWDLGGDDRYFCSSR